MEQLRRRGGGVYGALHLGRAREWLEAISAGDGRIEEVVCRLSGPPRCNRRAYQVTDSYRPGMSWVGETPRAALNKAGWFPPKAFGSVT